MDALIRFGPVLRDLVEFRFVRFVVAANRIGLGPNLTEQVAEHLFGSDRHMPPLPMRRELWSLQDGVCLYTGAEVGDPTQRSGSSSLDHVVPWSRIRVSAIENLVLTTQSVNSTKSNLLLALAHVEAWAYYMQEHVEERNDIAVRYGWPTDIARVAGVTSAIYRRAPPATPV